MSISHFLIIANSLLVVLFPTQRDLASTARGPFQIRLCSQDNLDAVFVHMDVELRGPPPSSPYECSWKFQKLDLLPSALSGEVVFDQERHF